MENLPNPEEEKEYQYDVLVTLGGGIREHKGTWRTTNYSEGDDYGTLGSRTRIIATEYLHEKGDVAKNFLETTGKPKYLEGKENAPGESEVAREELIKRGIPKESIFIENTSKNTAQNIENVLAIAKEHGWTRLLILSSNYHVPRIKALYENYVQEHPEYQGWQIDFKGAEDVLVGMNQKWKQYIDQAYTLEDMKKRIANEEKGIKDLRAKKYQSIQDNPEK